jgi:predicted metal-dependent phosphoesterase TrpH
MKIALIARQWTCLPAILAVVWCQPTCGADASPQPKIDILSPAPHANLKGIVDVRAKITPALPGHKPPSVHAALGGPPFVELKPLAETDQWGSQIDSALVPNGETNLIVIAWAPKEKRGTATAPVKIENPLHCYFADLHSHTAYSDGALFPANAYAYARNVAKLDVFALTDHLESLDDAEWMDIREQSWKANQDGRFVTLPGLEWTKKQGHVVILDPGVRQWPNDTAGLYKAAAKRGVILKFNHPGDGTKVFDGLAYSPVGDKAVRLIEVRSAEEEKAYLRALKLGWHLAPDGSDDSHTPNWGKNRTWTAILAPGLSKRNIWAALKARHCYSTLDRTCTLFFAVNDALMGDVVSKPVQKVRINVSVDDPDATDKIAKIELFEDGAVVQTEQANAPHHRWKTTCSPPSGQHYYFVKVTQADGNLLWSAPVWVTMEKDKIAAGRN